MPLPPPWNRLRWHAPDRFSVGAVQFDLVSWGSPPKRSTPDRLVLVKDAPFAASMARILASHRIDTMVEIGVYHGAGLALFDQLYAPRRIVGFDDRPAVPNALAGYIAAHRAADRIVAIPGVDQADAGRVTDLLDRHAGDGGLDLVIDDASHQYAPTRIAFEVAFPRLRPGGIYLIEDWGWAHWRGVFDGPPPFEGPPLSRLLMELMMVQAAAPDLIGRIEVDPFHAAIVRGPGTIGGHLDLDAHLSHRICIRELESTTPGSPPSA